MRTLADGAVAARWSERSTRHIPFRGSFSISTPTHDCRIEARLPVRPAGVARTSKVSQERGTLYPTFFVLRLRGSHFPKIELVLRYFRLRVEHCQELCHQVALKTCGNAVCNRIAPPAETLFSTRQFRGKVDVLNVGEIEVSELLGLALRTARRVGSDAPCSCARSSHAPCSCASESDAPCSCAQSSDAPCRCAPESDAPCRSAPESDAPCSCACSSDAPNRNATESDAPCSCAPSSDAPCSCAPESDAPCSCAPESIAPSSCASSSLAPCSCAPYSDAPCSCAPVKSALRRSAR